MRRFGEPTNGGGAEGGWRLADFTAWEETPRLKGPPIWLICLTAGVAAVLAYQIWC
jgi:hypothetical protein